MRAAVFTGGPDIDIDRAGLQLPAMLFMLLMAVWIRLYPPMLSRRK
jgi:hypothetical protein